MKKLDEYGYPTEEILEYIEKYNTTKNFNEFIKLIEELWRYEDRFVLKDNRLYLSTGGWSGNESIISALERNQFFWLIAWEKSVKGGHYWFNLNKYKKRIKELKKCIEEMEEK